MFKPSSTSLTNISATVVLPGQPVINAGELVGKVLYQAVED